MRGSGAQRRVGEMHSISAIDFATPKGFVRIRDIGDPYSVAGKFQVTRRYTGEIREKFASLGVVLHEFGTRLRTLNK